MHAPNTSIHVPKIGRTWHGERVMDDLHGPLTRLTDWLPTFDRVPLRGNDSRHLIVRQGDGVEIAVVSQHYALIQHADIVGDFTAAARVAGIDPFRLRGRLTLTEHGTRMALRVLLPKDLALRPPDGNPMGLTFECFNSVDGSVSVQGLLGWFRFVCGNGLAVGTTTARVNRKHLPGIDEPDFTEVLTTGLEEAAREHDALKDWADTAVTRQALTEWVDQAVAERWGPVAASRVFATATTGVDGTPRLERRKVPPHLRRLTPTIRVPGTPAPCRSRFDVVQVLAWVASRRNSVSEQLEWRAAIGPLMTSLTSCGNAAVRG